MSIEIPYGYGAKIMNDITPKPRSIGYKVKRAKNLVEVNPIVKKWLEDWRSEQMACIKRMESSIINDSYDDACIATGRLKALTINKFSGLETIFNFYQQHTKESVDDPKL